MNEAGLTPLAQARTCAQLLTLVAARWPDKVALQSPDGSSRTFAEIDRRINRLNHALIARGLAPGDRVAIVSRNSAQYLEVVGLIKCGAVIVPLNWRLAAPELARLLAHSAPRVVFVDTHHLALIESLRAALPEVAHWVHIGVPAPGWTAYDDLIAAGDSGPVRVSVQPWDPLSIVYTSGTTGQPKGVTLTHAGALGNCRTGAREMLGLTEQDRTLAVMPLFHVGGMWYHFFPSFTTGCTTLLLSEFDPGRVLHELAARRITNVHLVPTMIGAMLQHPDANRVDLSAVRLLFYAASSMPAELLRSAMAVFNQCGFAQAYGSTEGGVVTVLDRQAHERARTPDGEHLLRSCGRPMSGRALRIVDAQGQGVPLGAIGEIEVASPDLMRGYWNDEAATRHVLRGEWLATGDLGYQDGEGFLYIVDRKNDLIVTGGENVYPSEVEDHLYADPDVQEAAVFGVPDARWVEKVVAAVVIKPGHPANEQALIERLKARLAPYKCPKQIHFTDSLPKSAVGKVLRKHLRALYARPS